MTYAVATPHDFDIHLLMRGIELLSRHNPESKGFLLLKAHPWQVRDLRQSIGSDEWFLIQKAVLHVPKEQRPKDFSIIALFAERVWIVENNEIQEHTDSPGYRDAVLTELKNDGVVCILSSHAVARDHKPSNEPRVATERVGGAAGAR
jgi:hypothetical protein